jgi:uncharacterized phage protein (TIGR01671 family)
MNREIKFRLWVPSGKKFLLTDNLQFNTEVKIDIFSTQPPVWQEYTGLKDKNGQEIFEGDLIFVDEALWEVYFDFGVFLIRPHEYPTDKPSCLYEYNKDCEVVAHIYAS